MVWIWLGCLSLLLLVSLALNAFLAAAVWGTGEGVVKGEQGPKGENGEKGEPGEPGKGYKDWLAATGQWILIQRRGQFGNPKDFFSKKLWVDYEQGFGDPKKEFWLGLWNISSLTSSICSSWMLKVAL